MGSILKGKKKTTPTTIRFESGQIPAAKELNINVGEVCRQALARAIESLQTKKLAKPKKTG